MRRTLDLVPAPLSDVELVQEGASMMMRATGDTPRLALTAAGGERFALSPGDYAFELKILGSEPDRLQLVCAGLEGQTRSFDLFAQGDRWRAALALSQTITDLTLTLSGAGGAFALASCVVSTELSEPPSLRAAILQFARGVYHQSPRGLRRAVTRFAARSPALRGLRTSVAPENKNSGGRIRLASEERDVGAELEARRGDFDSRLATARGLPEAAQPVAIEQGGARSARIIAFHLPQFHRIPENDDWWGAGFTEWTNVSRAIPQFLGHHQPRLPGELGFYDLTAPGALRRQVELAASHGVSAFCFHYYWFAGRRLLEKPLDAFLADPSLNLQFSLCWANENWTRRWDGAEHDVLIAQSHSREDHVRVFDDMAKYLEDPRALRIAGRPLIVVYRPALIPDAHAMTDIWRERAAKRGWPGLYLAATDAFFFEAPERLGFDGLVEFPPHGLTPPRIEKRLSWLNPGHRGAVFDYTETAAEAIARLNKRGRGRADVFPGVMPGWDNEARRAGAGNIFHGATPQAYANWLAAACDAAARTLPADRQLVFVNAWNEWAEGAYLEPDRKWGRALLEATAAVAGVRPRQA